MNDEYSKWLKNSKSFDRHKQILEENTEEMLERKLVDEPDIGPGKWWDMDAIRRGLISPIHQSKRDTQLKTDQTEQVGQCSSSKSANITRHSKDDSNDPPVVKWKLGGRTLKSAAERQSTGDSHTSHSAKKRHKKKCHSKGRHHKPSNLDSTRAVEKGSRRHDIQPVMSEEDRKKANDEEDAALIRRMTRFITMPQYELPKAKPNKSPELTASNTGSTSNETLKGSD